MYESKGRNRPFQLERRRVQRQVVQSVLLCGLVLVVLYALIVIATGIFIVYTQFFAPDLISSLNAGQGHYVQIREKRMDERLLRDPVARLLQADELKVDGGLQTFAPYEEYDDNSDEKKQIENAAAAIDNFEHKLPSSSSDTFPTDLFTLDQRRHGAIILHVCGLLYMFLALSIVCDEFFVPSLSVISEILEISDDVAGATFMAAGGSAPEFFTSMFGVFITANNVGVGTIVGSATFNILFVLSFCTFFSKEVLHLTWWPMFRDIVFYMLSLLLLLIFFIDEIVDWHEALVLFGLYVIYGIFMKYNTLIERVVKRNLKSMTASVGIERKILVEVENNENKADGHFLSKHLPIISTMRTLPVLHTGAMFRSGLVQIAMEPEVLAGPDSDETPPPNITLLATSELASSTISSARLPRRLSKTRSSPSMSIRASLPHILPHTASQLKLTANLAKLSVTDLPGSSRTTSSIWSTSTAISTSKLNRHRQSQIVNGADLKALERPKANGRLDVETPVQLSNGVNIKRISVEVQPEAPINMSWPSTHYKRCVYILLAPIMFPLYATLPDVKKPNRRRLFLWTFSGSICWIACYSYLMVWFANTIGETIALPNELMGLTILAAGTSIPDLITSVIVARKGLGDMAVSSSIGSNLFDVCVGLPVPWLLHYLAGFFKPSIQQISVESKGLTCSIGMLFIMLMVLYASVALSGWKMSTNFGISMIMSYLLFCMLSILLEVDYLICPLKQWSTAVMC
ncbi:hypothetical protein M3Y97_00025700 [Aphelenchoides bicaudatus]|nr:hypothetical protein M3Y97_00025700 [Aphelenchoides bicaudatus]